MKQARVIGAGFTGTLAAYLLSHRGYQVKVIEPNEHWGGLIQTIPHSGGDIETAANGFMSSPLIEEIADNIGVKLILASKLARKNRWLWIGSGPKKWPLGPLETLGFIGRIFWGWLRSSMTPQSGESLEQWGYRVLGKPATQKLLSTAVLGIYAAPISELSASLVVGRFFRKSTPPQRRSRLRGTVAPEKGMGQWFQAMRAHLESRGVQFLRQQHSPLTSSEEPVFICTSAPEAAQLLAPLAPELSRVLQEIEMLPIVSVTAFAPMGSADLRGFGCLFHPEAGFHSLGTLWNSDIFPHRFSPELRAENWILGGRSKRVSPTLSDPEILALVQHDRIKLGRSTAIQEARITRWPKAFPIYNLKLEQLLATAPKPPGKVVLCGNYLGSLGLSQIALRVQKTVEEFAS